MIHAQVAVFQLPSRLFFWWGLFERMPGDAGSCEEALPLCALRRVEVPWHVRGRLKRTYGKDLHAVNWYPSSNADTNTESNGYC
eukprot:3494507-Amphidinium_carterae.1